MEYTEIVDAIYAKYMLTVKAVNKLKEEKVVMDIEKIVEHQAKINYLSKLRYFYLDIIVECKIDKNKLDNMARAAVESRKRIMSQMEEELDPKKLIDLVYDLNTKNAILDGYNAVIDLIEEGK